MKYVTESVRTFVLLNTLAFVPKLFRAYLFDRVSLIPSSTTDSWMSITFMAVGICYGLMDGMNTYFMSYQQFTLNNVWNTNGEWCFETWEHMLPLFRNLSYTHFEFFKNWNKKFVRTSSCATHSQSRSIKNRLIMWRM
jgi:hypothetical protein